jgi:hypothetical protein
MAKLTTSNLNDTLNSRIAAGEAANAAIANIVSLAISSVQIANSSYAVLDDTAANTSGTSYLVVNGSGFNSNCIVIVGATNASSTTFANSKQLRAAVAAQNAASYPVYVTDTATGATAIKVNGLTFSSFPVWGTATALANVSSNTVFSTLLSANSDSSVIYSNTTILPTGTTLLSNGYFYGNISVGAATTYSFDIRATDNENQDSDKTFSLSAILPVPSDPYYSYTGVILKADSSPFVDNSFYASAITNTTGVTRNTGTKKYDAGSAQFTRSASTQLLVATNNNLDLASTFTMEAWVYLYSHPSGLNSICGKWGGSNYSYLFALTSSGSMATTQLNVYFNEGVTGPSFTFSTPTLNTGAWYHIALVRNGSSLLAFLNGTQVGSTQTYSGTPATRSGPLSIGSANEDAHHFDGLIDDLRITRGIARYTTTFTPPDSVPTV